MATHNINITVPDADETTKGIIEIATQAETNTGTDDTKALTPLKLEQSDLVQTTVAANTAKVTNATHTGQVTGSGALTVDKTAITDQTTATVASGDLVLISDIDNSNNLKKVTAQSIADLGGGSGTNFVTYFHINNYTFPDGANAKIDQTASVSAGVLYDMVPLPDCTLKAVYTTVSSNSTIASGEDNVLKVVSNGGADTFTVASDFKLNANRTLYQEYTGLSEAITAGGSYIQIDVGTLATNPAATKVKVILEIEI